MSAYVHPSSAELTAALTDPQDRSWALEHLDECIACRVRMSRVRQTAGLPPVSGDSLQRILDASRPIPTLKPDLMRASGQRAVEPSEVWRAGLTEAVLVWVRKVFDDGVVDVVPVVVDTDLAEQESILVPSEASPLGTPLAVMVSLRTHIDHRALLNRIGSLEIGDDVEEVIGAVREDRMPNGVVVGQPIIADDDQRFEFRQALRDVLAELSPNAWSEANLIGTPPAHLEFPAVWEESVAAIDSELSLYLQSAQCRRTEPTLIPIDATSTARSFMKVVYLDTAVLLTAIDDDSLSEFPTIDALAAACQKFVRVEPDADAVAVAMPGLNWETMLFTTAHMRGALEVPTGAVSGPTPTIRGFGLVETVCKHLEGAVTAWEVTEASDSRLAVKDLNAVAARHAKAARLTVVAEGKRAKQVAKRAAWEALTTSLDDKVAHFVTAILNRESFDAAVVELQLDRTDD